MKTTAENSQPPIVLVTGSSRGLGRGTALILADAGFSVIIHYAGNQDAAEQTADDCRKRAADPKRQKFPIVQGDLGDAKAREKLLKSVLDKAGHIDALVNNAGMAPRERLDIVEASEENFEEVLRVNLQGPYFLTQQVVRYWLENPEKCRIAGGYKLIFVTSISANTASINRGEYCIAKAGLAMANQLWAARLAEHDIQSIELRPGIMKTDMTSGVTEKYEKIFAETDAVPQKRWGTPEDLGLAVKAVCENHFPFSTGAVIQVDGGFNIRKL